jgi:hypothetical protein
MTCEDTPAGADGLFPHRLETDRLELERLCHDTVDIFECYRRRSRHEPDIEEVTAFLPWDPHETVGETADYVDELEQKWDDGVRAEYLLRPKPGEDGAGEVAGSACLIVDWETRTATPGIWLRKRLWGRGTLANAPGRWPNSRSSASTWNWSRSRSRTATRSPGRPSRPTSKTWAASTTVSSGTRRSGPMGASSTTTATR